jgi:cell division septation protein DedD
MRPGYSLTTLEKSLRALAALIVVAALMACGEARPRRLPESGFQVKLEAHEVPREIKVNETAVAEITVTNASPVIWPSKSDERGRFGVHLAYHWLSEKGTMVVFDGLRTAFPNDVKPGESVDLKANIRAPEKAGRYVLEVTLVQERSAWFPEKNGAKLVFPVSVLDLDEPGSETASPASVAPARGKAATPISKTRETERPLRESAAAKSPATKSAGSDEMSKRSAARDSGGSWTVQLGSFPKKEAAGNMAASLKGKGYDAYVSAVSLKGSEWHRVRVGRFDRREDAEKLRETLRVAEKLERSIVTSR